MSDMRTQLRRYLDETPPIMFDEITAARPSQGVVSRTRDLMPGWAMAMAVTVVALIIIGTASVLLGGSDGSVGPRPPAGVTTTAAASGTTGIDTMDVIDLPHLSWSRIDTPGLPGPYLFFDGIAAGGPGMVAVGAPDGLEPEMIWVSATGDNWVAAEVAAHGYAYAYDVTAGGPGLVAVGSTVWTSVDGMVWNTPDIDPFSGEARAVTAGGPGLVAVGRFVGGRAAVWTSPDGLAWTMVPRTSISSGDVYGNAMMHDVIEGGPGLIAVGRVGDSAAVWTSPDGFAWSRVAHDPVVFGGGPVETEMLSVTAGGPGYVAVSAISDTGMGVWTSPDGTTWSAVSLDPDVFDGDEEMTVIIGTATGLISAGMEGHDAAAWFSADGVTWTRLNHGGTFDSEGLEGINDIAIVDDGLVAVGWSNRDGEWSGSVWVGRSASAGSDR